MFSVSFTISQKCFLSQMFTTFFYFGFLSLKATAGVSQGQKAHDVTFFQQFSFPRVLITDVLNWLILASTLVNF